MTVLPTDYHSLKTKHFRDSFLIFLGGLIIFTIGLSPEFIGSQARFALFAQEMLHYGPTFFPTTYQIPYPDYPATSTFLIYLLSLPFGKLTIFTAVLPTAVSSAGILLCMYRIGVLQSRQWGILAVLLALFTYEFLSESRSIALDQYTSLATVLCFYLAYSATVLSRYQRLRWIPLIFVIGFSFRGPIGLVIPAAITCGFFCWEKQYRKCLIFAVTALVLLGCCSVALLAAARQQGGEILVRKVLQMQGLGRIELYSNNYFYYIGKGFTAYMVSFPLAAIVVITGFKKMIKRENANYKLIGHLALWLVILLIGLSIPGTKKTRYLLPIVPATALLAAYLFVGSTSEVIFTRLRKIFLEICNILPWVAGIGTIAFCIPNPYFTSLSPFQGLLVLIILISIIVFHLWAYRKGREFPQNQFLTIALAVLSFLIFYLGIITPWLGARERTRPFAAIVEKVLQAQSGKMAFYQIGPNAADIKLMVNMQNPVIPEFVKNSEDLLLFPPTTCFIAQEKVFEHLPAEIRQKCHLQLYGNIGHKKYVVFSQKAVNPTVFAPDE